MKKLEYTVRFVTSAFLGNAEQAGQWRTPPFKALLRQWWRVAYAADHGFRMNVADMRREEGRLFGNAWLEKDFCKSLVRLRLDRWAEGQLKSWGGLEQPAVFHPEVQRTGYKVGPHAYLGYGPLDGRGNTKLSEKVSAAIQVGETAKLAIAIPQEHAPRIERALWFTDRYGTLGGRSRNGWGSVAIEPLNGTPKLDGTLPSRLWEQCLDRDWDWPHAIGRDDKPLIWETTADYGSDWKNLMRDLAIVKIGLRTQFMFPPVTPPHAGIEPRHWLSYPITTHTTRVWERGARLPNQLRFKVRKREDGKLVGVIFHVPHLPPPAFSPNPSVIQATWRQVHALLDELTKLGSTRSYSMITDVKRRADLKSHLNTVMLKRITE